MTYKEFIDNILETRGRFACGEEYHERHHIVPKCMGGTNDEDNLIDLFAREHFEAHRLLALENLENEKLVYAWWMMSYTNNVHGRRYDVTADEYEELKKIAINKISESHRGRPLSESHKQKIANGNKGRVVSDQTKEKISKANKGRTQTDEAKKKNSDKHRGKNHPQYGTHRSNETKQKISSSHKGKKLSDDTKKKLSKSHKKENLSDETLKKMRESHLGIVPSVETIKKRSMALKGRKRDLGKLHKMNQKIIYCVEINQIYRSTMCSYEETNISKGNICQACSNKRDAAGGYHWHYLYDQTRKDGTVIQGAISLGLITEEEALKQLNNDTK